MNAIDDTQRKAARVTGIAYLVSFAAVVGVNFGIFARLIVRDNPADTARNILAQEQLFRIGIAGDLVYCVGTLIVAAGLYVILRPIGRNLALFAAFGRLILGVMWLLVTLNLFTVLRLLGDAEYGRMFGQEQLHAFIRLHLTGTDQYYIGLLFWALAATAVAYLWFKSNFIPKPLAVFGVVSSAWCVVCTVVFYISPSFAKVVNLWWFDSPMVIFEIITSFWLLFRGLRPSGVAEREQAEAGLADHRLK